MSGTWWPNPEPRGDRDHGGGSTTARKIECWRCGADHMKRDCPKRADEKENEKKNREDPKNKRAEATGGKLHVVYTSSGDAPLRTDFSELG